jgi:predicted DNA-binding transcriptional regulator AlpA
MSKEAFDALMGQSTAAEFLGLSPRTLERWRLEGRGPKYLKLGPRAVRYSLASLREFLAASVKTSTSEAK